MKPSDQLYRLIKSLDRSEKGYFKKYAAAYGKSQNYLALFDAIDAQEEYDETIILKKFKNQPLARQLAVAKNYLWELILKSQRQYRAESGKFMQMNALMESGDILFEKGLYEEAMRAWEKAKLLAAEFDEKPFILDIETNKRRYYIDMTAGDWKKYTEPSYEESFKLIAAYERMLRIQYKYVHIINVIKVQPFFRTEEQRSEWDAFMQDPLLDIHAEPEDFYAKLYYNYIYNIYHLLCRNKEQALIYIKKIVDIWDTHQSLKEIEPIKYLSAVNNYLTNLMYLREYDAFVTYYDTFQPPQLSSVAREAVYFEHLWLMRSTYYQLKGEIDALIIWANTTLNDLHRFGPLMNKTRLLIIHFSLGHLETIQGNYEKSNEYLQLVFDSKEVELRKDIQAMSRVLYTINHFELQNLVFFNHVITTSKHYLKAQDYYYETERVFMRFMNRLAKEPDSKAIREIFVEMHAVISKLFNELEAERMAFESVRLLEWMESHTSNVSYLTKVREAKILNS